MRLSMSHLLRVSCPIGLAVVAATMLHMSPVQAKAAKPKDKGRGNDLVFPPTLPGGEEVVTDRSDEFLKPPSTLLPGVTVARTPPIIEFRFCPGQDYPGKPWSVWGDSLAVGTKCFFSFGDHLAPGGNAFVYEYDAETNKLRRLVDVRELLHLPDGHYTPKTNGT